VLIPNVTAAHLTTSIDVRITREVNNMWNYHLPQLLYVFFVAGVAVGLGVGVACGIFIATWNEEER